MLKLTSCRVLHCGCFFCCFFVFFLLKSKRQTQKLKLIASNIFSHFFPGVSHNSWESCCFPALSWFCWHFRAANAFFSICFPKSSHPFWGSLFALRTSVTVSELAGTVWTAQQGHLPPTAICAQVLLIPLSLSTFLPLPPQLACTLTALNTYVHAHTYSMYT